MSTMTILGRSDARGTVSILGGAGGAPTAAADEIATTRGTDTMRNWEVTIPETQHKRQIVTVRARTAQAAAQRAKGYLRGDDGDEDIISHDERDDGSEWGDVLSVEEVG